MVHRSYFRGMTTHEDNMARRILRHSKWERSSRRAAVTVGVVALCAACGDPTASEGSRLEALPYDAIGPGLLVFERSSVGHGLYLANGASRTAQMLLSDAFVRGAVLSPNGKQLAYSRLYGPLLLTQTDLAVRDLTTGVESRLTQDTLHQGMPSWAPNGQELVYPSNGAAFYLFDYWQTSASATGASARRNLTQLRITGQLICPYGELAIPAVLSVRDQLAWLCRGRVYTKSAGADGSALAVSGPDGNPVAVAWSPDGLRLAYSAFFGDQLVVRVVSRDGGAPTTIASVASTPSNWAHFNLNSLCWTADGSRLFFNATRGNESSHVWVVRSDGSGLLQITSRPGVRDFNVSCT